MKKIGLVLFILLDLGVIGASAWFLYTRVEQTSVEGTASNSMAKSEGAPSVSPRSAGSPIVLSSAPQAFSPPVSGSSRKIGFMYPNSRAKSVTIRADFTGWRAEPMQKDPGGTVWKYMAVLEPGEYAYCFSVDDKKPIRDPFNKRTKKVGTTFVSSIIVDAAVHPLR